MRKITKNAEPREWTRFRLTPGAHFQARPELVHSLLEEQGYICAYCERRIPCKDGLGAENHRIEHLRPQQLARETGDDSDMDYGNMVVCCPGNISQGGEANYHCDKKKGNSILKISPLDGNAITTIRFTHSGFIKSTDRQIDREINENLNLNQSLLVENRKEVWMGVVENMEKCGWNAGTVSRMIKTWESKHEVKAGNGRVMAYRPFCSMVLFMLHKKLNMKIKS